MIRFNHVRLLASICTFYAIMKEFGGDQKGVESLEISLIGIRAAKSVSDVKGS